MGPELEWQEAIAAGELKLQRAKKSGRYFFPPRVAEPLTGDPEWEWVTASGEGTVYSATTITPRAPAQPYNVVLVDLAEGVRLMSRVEGMETVEIGTKVRAFIDRSGEAPLLLFRPA